MEEENIYKKRLKKITEIERTIHENNMVLPYVHDIRVQTEFMSDFLEQKPSRLAFLPNSGVDKQIEALGAVVIKYQAGEFISCASSTTAEVTVCIRAANTLVPQSEAEVRWQVDTGQSFKNIEDSDFHIKTSGETLNVLFPELTQEFDSAVNTYKSFKNDDSQRLNIGIQLRSFLEHLQGKMWGKVKNKKGRVSWERIAEELAKNGTGSTEYNSLRRKREDWTYLHNELTKVGKGNEHKDRVDLETVFKTWIDFIYSVLLLLDADKVKLQG